MDKKLKIIDLFAGIGGIRLGFEKIGVECVFSSEWDKHAQDMYEENFGERPVMLPQKIFQTTIFF